jgi:hypothetical protein
MHKEHVYGHRKKTKQLCKSYTGKKALWRFKMMSIPSNSRFPILQTFVHPALHGLWSLAFARNCENTSANFGRSKIQVVVSRKEGATAGMCVYSHAGKTLSHVKGPLSV